MIEPAQPVTVLRGGRVFTAAPAGWTEAVAYRGARIEAVGTLSDLLDRFPDARQIDVGGRTVLPGLIDAHNHFLATGESLAAVDARYPGMASIEDLVQALASAATTAAPGAWVTAFGFDDAKYEAALTRWDLDRAAADRPIGVYHVSGHHVVVNSRAAGGPRPRRDDAGPTGRPARP